MKKKKQKILQPNVIEGFDEVNGKWERTMYYWQKEPIATRKGMLYTIPWYRWWNPIWRFNQWRMMNKPIHFTGL